MRGRGQINSNVPKKASLLFSVLHTSKATLPLNFHNFICNLFLTRDIDRNHFVFFSSSWVAEGKKLKTFFFLFLHSELQWWLFAAVAVVVPANNNLAAMVTIAGCAKTPGQNNEQEEPSEYTIQCKRL